MNHFVLTKSTRRSQFGLTMVELMVSITIGTILSAGIIQIFIGNKTAYEISDSLTELQENGRSALARLNDSIMMADHWGIMDTESVATTLNAANAIQASIAGIGNCNGGWAMQTTTKAGDTVVNSMQGYDGQLSITSIETATSLPAGCVTDYVANSDILVLRYADSRQLVPKISVTSTSYPNNAKTIFVRGGMINNAKVLSLSTNLVLGENIPNPTTPDGAGIYNYPYRVELYYLKTCSRTDSTGCINSTPTLTRLSLSSEGNIVPTLTEEAIVENIEQIQFLYGIDNDNDGFMDQYSTATAINASPSDALDWIQVISVHVSFVVRSDKKDMQHTDTNSYSLLDYTYTPTTTEANYRRKVYDQVIQIRNRTRS